MASPTLRELTGMNPNPSSISESALVLIDCQQLSRRHHALTVRVPEIDAGAFQPCAIFDGSNLQGKCKRRASPLLGNVGAHELRVEIERTLHSLRREDAQLGAREHGGKALLRRKASACGEAEAERCRGAGQGLAARQASRLIFAVLAHDSGTRQ